MKEYWLTFLNDAGLDDKASEDYANAFIENEMSPDMIRELCHGLLLMLGVKKVGHRLKILHLKDIIKEAGGMGRHPTPLHHAGHTPKKRGRTVSVPSSGKRERREKENAKETPTSVTSKEENDPAREEPHHGEKEHHDPLQFSEGEDTDTVPPSPQRADAAEARSGEDTPRKRKKKHRRHSDEREDAEQEDPEKKPRANSTPGSLVILKHNSLPELLGSCSPAPMSSSAPAESPKRKIKMGMVAMKSSPSIMLPTKTERDALDKSQRRKGKDDTDADNEERHQKLVQRAQSEFHPYIEIDGAPPVIGDNLADDVVNTKDTVPYGSRLWTDSTIPSALGEKIGNGQSTLRFYDQMSEGAKKSVIIGRIGRTESDEFLDMGPYTEIKYYFNLQAEKRYEHVSGPATQVSLSTALSISHRLAIGSFVIFHINDAGDFEPLKKEDVLDPGETYYVIESDRLQQKILNKLKSRLKNEKVILDSVNTPLDVDFVEAKQLYMAENGKIGLCMAPGRKKKKKKHIWQRDLGQDLDRLQQVYGCNVLVTLVREQELRDLKITDIFDELKKRNIGSLFLPIKDKWIPKSTPDLIALVHKIINCLKQGKTVVVHCNGGKGRSATVIVATLIAMGRSISESIRIVQGTRKGTIRNPLQQAYLRRFRKEWNERQKRSKLLKDVKQLSEEGDEPNISGVDDESDYNTESDYDSEEFEGSGLDGDNEVYSDDEGNVKNSLTKKLNRMKKRMENYEKKIEKRERELCKDRDRLEFYREEVKKVAGLLERKARPGSTIKRQKSAMKTSREISRSSRELKKEALVHEKDKEKEREEKKDKKEKEDKEEKHRDRDRDEAEQL